MSIVESKINKIKVNKILVDNELPPERILGYDMFPILYSAIFLTAKKKSGKTNVIANILDKCADKDTKIMFFVSTIHKDSTYKAILKNLDKKKISYNVHESFLEDGINYIDELVNILNEQAKEDEVNLAMIEEKKNNPEKVIPFLNFSNGEISVEEKKLKKKKVVSPEWILVFDDLSFLLKDPSISYLLKRMRHFKMKIIISSQYLLDLKPESIKQIDYSLIFRSFDEDKLEKLYRGLDISIDNGGFNKFIDLYNYATSEPFSFLYTSALGEFRKNFNTKLEIK
jgi:hypothetical protein